MQRTEETYNPLQSTYRTTKVANMDTVLTCLEIGVARRDVGLVEAGLANILICISSGGMTSNKLILATSDLVGDILTSASISERFSSVSVMIGLGSTVLSKLAGVRAGLA